MEQVKIVEVGPRDGLQNEKQIIESHVKVDFINQLSNTGLEFIEASSFVNPIKIPQLADAETVFEEIQRHGNVHYSALVPNRRGVERAIQAKAQGVAVFTAASETFCQKNIQCDIAESLNRFKPAIELALENNIELRAYISCVMGCPYEGDIEAGNVINLCKELYDMGCKEISLGDTIGIGTAKAARQLIKDCATEIPVSSIAVHFHDTRGQALANIYACMEEGVRIIDASAAGLGGCPYAPGASGNVATEDVVYMLHGMGFHTGIDLDKLIKTGHWICQQLDRLNMSKMAMGGIPICLS